MQGLGAPAIAKLRCTSYRTVANQLASIYRKAGVSSMPELVAWMLREPA
jgi:DNA-binding CsgD family transcriptional regulator